MGGTSCTCSTRHASIVDINEKFNCEEGRTYLCIEVVLVDPFSFLDGYLKTIGSIRLVPWAISRSFPPAPRCPFTDIAKRSLLLRSADGRSTLQGGQEVLLVVIS